MSDLGLVLWAPEDGHVSQRSVPPHQSRLAGGRQRTGTKCRSAERAVEERELDLWARRGARRGGGAGLGQGSNSLWGGACACEGRVL